MLQCVAVRCIALQCAAVCCIVLQRVAVRCSMLQFVAAYCIVLQRAAVCCSILYCVAVCYSVLQCVVACCSVVQCDAVCCSVSWSERGNPRNMPRVAPAHVYTQERLLLCGALQIIVGIEWHVCRVLRHVITHTQSMTSLYNRMHAANQMK